MNEVVSLSSDQVDLIVSVIVVCSCCISFCLGFISHESSGK